MKNSYVYKVFDHAIRKKFGISDYELIEIRESVEDGKKIYFIKFNLNFSPNNKVTKDMPIAETSFKKLARNYAFEKLLGNDS